MGVLEADGMGRPGIGNRMRRSDVGLRMLRALCGRPGVHECDQRVMVAALAGVALVGYAAEG